MRSKVLRSKIHRPKKAKRVAASRTRIGMILSAVVLALTIGTIALSHSSSQVSQKKFVATKKIRIDPVTGELRKPTQEETDEMVRSIEQLTNRSSEGLTVSTRANGTSAVDLQGRFQTVVVVRANADGTMETKCVTSMDEAAEFLGLVLADAPSNDSPGSAN